MKIALVGRVATEIELYDGQTVKTRSLYNLLKEIEDIDHVFLVDTYEYKKHFLRVLFQSFNILINCDKIVLSISINGRKFFFPYFYYLNKIFRKDIYHSLIGGRLAQNIKEHPSWKRYVNSFKVNWVESRKIVEDLKAIGVSNAEYLPNFKHIRTLTNNELPKYDKEVFVFCTFSRVQERKGITDAIEAIKAINNQYGNQIAELDIYGPIDEEYAFKFNELIETNKGIVNYKGCINANQSVEVIKNYYALLFPTRYFNEGIPGTIIDAFAAGVPVIARKWHYCDEMISDKVNGLVYDFDKPEMLVETMCFAINHSELMNKMKINCLKKSREYMYESVKLQIADSIKNKGK